MMRSMTRWTLAGFMALAALGAVAVLDVGSATAEAAPSVSPFAGSWSDTYGYGPWNGYGHWPATITISDGGQITSSFSSADSREKGSISGRVSADGRFSYTVRRYYYHDSEWSRERGSWSWSTWETVGNMAFDAYGNIVLTTGNGGSFVWLRQ